MKSCLKLVTAGALFVVLGLTHNVSAGGLRRLSANTNCEFAVALRGSAKLNAECTNICKSRPQDMETEGCGFVDVRNTDGGVKADRCFSGHIYGYVEGEAKRVGIDHHKNIKSPHECQQLCQENPDCVNFIWTTPQLGGDYKPNCSLKSQAYLDNAWLGSGEFNDDYCNRGMSQACYEMNHYECMGINTCIWCAKMYLSGPAHCHMDSLGPAAGPEGYPICDGIPDFEYSTTPNPENPTRPPHASTLPWTVPGKSTTTTASIKTTTMSEGSITTLPSIVDPNTTGEASVESSSTESNAPSSTEDFVPVTEDSSSSTEEPKSTSSTTTAASVAGTVAGAVAGTGAVVAAAGYGVASFVGSSASAADVSIGQFEGNASSNIQPQERETGIRVAEDDFL